MAKWRASVALTLNIDYEDIEADTEEEAKRIAQDMAYEDVDWNNCDCSDDAFVFVYEQDEESEV